MAINPSSLARCVMISIFYIVKKQNTICPQINGGLVAKFIYIRAT